MGFYRQRVLPPLIAHAMRTPELAPYRARAVARVEGRVLEIGIGSGLNLPLYHARVEHLFGLDPSPWLLARSRERALRAPVPVTLIQGSAEQIPLDRASVNTVLSAWTLCSVGDLERVLEDIRRVLAPGGRLVFVEHGLADDAGIRRWQRRLTPLWRRISGGCHLDRPIAAAVVAAGFDMGPLSVGYLRQPSVATFLYEGVARPR